MAKGKNPFPSAAVLAAKARRSARGGKDAVRFESFVDDFSNKVRLTLRNRVRIATEFLKSKVVKNISVPVDKVKAKGSIKVVARSKPGEFPRADTTQLRKSVFSDVRTIKKGTYEGYVGTPIDYGLILEIFRDRSFLKRTHTEERGRMRAIISGPIK